MPWTDRTPILWVAASHHCSDRHLTLLKKVELNISWGRERHRYWQVYVQVEKPIPGSTGNQSLQVIWTCGSYDPHPWTASWSHHRTWTLFYFFSSFPFSSQPILVSTFSSPALKAVHWLTPSTTLLGCEGSMDPLLNSGCTSLYVIGCAPFNYKYPVVAIVRTSVLYLFLSCESNPLVTFKLNARLNLSWHVTVTTTIRLT